MRQRRASASSGEQNILSKAPVESPSRKNKFYIWRRKKGGASNRVLKDSSLFQKVCSREFGMKVR